MKIILIIAIIAALLLGALITRINLMRVYYVDKICENNDNAWRFYNKCKKNLHSYKTFWKMIRTKFHFKWIRVFNLFSLYFIWGYPLHLIGIGCRKIYKLYCKI